MSRRVLTTLFLSMVSSMSISSVSGQQPAPAPTPAPASDARAIFPDATPTAAPVAKTGATYPAPPAAADASRFGQGAQRTMGLLATSTAEHRKKVRILVYGQSISKQEWWLDVRDDLRRRFPYADLEMENRSIGGFAAPVIWRPANHDAYPWYPDLIIMHLHGGEPDYEAYLQNLRAHTTAELIIQCDHPKAFPSANPVGAELWTKNHNDVWNPSVAAKLGLESLDLRDQWLRYCTARGIDPKDLTYDGAHLNAEGNVLMGRLYMERLVYRPELMLEGSRNLTRDVAVTERSWVDGKLTVAFTGNRIVAFADPRSSSGGTARARAGAGARVLVDGQPPSSFPGCYAITRPGSVPGKDWPWEVWSNIRVSYERPLVLEEWTLTFTGFDAATAVATFTVEGSVTGPDGAGRSGERFVSKSGRVVIEPADWWLKEAQKLAGRRGMSMPEAVGWQIRWKVEPTFVDRYTSPQMDDPTREYPTVLAQGMSNGRHTLTLIAEDPANPPAIRFLRVHEPPVKDAPGLPVAVVVPAK